MGRSITHDDAVERLDAVGLEPIERFVSRNTEMRCRCKRCGTTRWVKLANLNRRDSVACRWCHGWEKLIPATEKMRASAATHRAINTNPLDSLAAVQSEGLIALTPPGDEFTPIGFLCPTCGETGVTVPERCWGCPRCRAARTREVLADAPRVFREHGLELVDRCRGESAPQSVDCVACGTRRKVSLARLRDGSAPLCWTCTYGIRPDEPHRLYLVHFPALRAMKVGLTHARHDRRLIDHEVTGGRVVAVVDVPDRASARRVERAILDRYAAWVVPDVTADELPQGGWTETWRDDAPPLDLVAEVRRLLDA